MNWMCVKWDKDGIAGCSRAPRPLCIPSHFCRNHRHSTREESKWEAVNSLPESRVHYFTTIVDFLRITGSHRFSNWFLFSWLEVGAGGRHGLLQYFNILLAGYRSVYLKKRWFNLPVVLFFSAFLYLYPSMIPHLSLCIWLAEKFFGFS